jgi:hypothetical protein
MSSTAATDQIHLYLYGMNGPRIRLDTMTDETREMLSSLLEAHLETPIGGASFVATTIERSHFPSEEVIRFAGSRRVRLGWGPARKPGCYKVELAVGGPRAEVTKLQEYIAILEEVRVKI